MFKSYIKYPITIFIFTVNRLHVSIHFGVCIHRNLTTSRGTAYETVKHRNNKHQKKYSDKLGVTRRLPIYCYKHQQQPYATSREITAFAGCCYLPQPIYNYASPCQNILTKYNDTTSVFTVEKSCWN